MSFKINCTYPIQLNFYKLNLDIRFFTGVGGGGGGNLGGNLTKTAG